VSGELVLEEASELSQKRQPNEMEVIIFIFILMNWRVKSNIRTNLQG